MKINCVVVTYNRLDLLKECLQAVEQQTFPCHRIIVVDNCSTDGTCEFLQQYCTRPQYHIIRTEKNIGGAGGFSIGIKESVREGADYTWIMDDDTIPTPTALEFLVKTITLSNDIGFVCSKVNWTDGTTHLRNIPGGLHKTGKKYIIKKEDITAYLCEVCTFVSVLFSSRAVYKVGLPIKEFFIWFDDIEYTYRITKSGFKNYYVEQSIVVHKTPDMFNPTIEQAPVSMASRFYYQTRNTCYFKHREQPNKFLFWLSVWNKLRIMKNRIKRRKDGHQQEFLEAVKRGCKDGLTFYPEIEYIPEPQQQQKKETT